MFTAKRTQNTKRSTCNFRGIVNEKLLKILSLLVGRECSLALIWVFKGIQKYRMKVKTTFFVSLKRIDHDKKQVGIYKQQFSTQQFILIRSN